MTVLTRTNRLVLFLIFYSTLLILLLPKLSLWLDEILDMMGSSHSVPELMLWASNNSGGVPLGYLAHWASFKLLGISAFSARLPSAVASVLACIGVFRIAKSMRFECLLLPVVVFAAIPLQLRYALEARPYLMALCASVWAIVLFESLIEEPAPRKFFMYAFVGILGMYTQPYFVFTLGAQAIWALTSKREVLAGLFVTLAAVLASFGVWYVYASGWSQILKGVEGVEAIGWASIGLIAHELTGIGYAGTVLMLLGITAGICHRKLQLRPINLTLWLLYLGVPIAGAVAADLLFGYFLAIRQMIFALAPLAILFSWGIESLTRRYRIPAFVLLVAFFFGALYEDIQLFRRPRENWEAASGVLQSEVAKGACIIFEPADNDIYYTFFVPELASSKCPAEKTEDYKRVAIARSPRYDKVTVDQWERKLSSMGMARIGEPRPVLPDIEIFSRP
jgi:hypothetical protein